MKVWRTTENNIDISPDSVALFYNESDALRDAAACIVDNFDELASLNKEMIKEQLVKHDYKRAIELFNAYHNTTIIIVEEVEINTECKEPDISKIM